MSIEKVATTELRLHHCRAAVGFLALLRRQGEIDLGDNELFAEIVNQATNHYDIPAGLIATRIGAHVSTVLRWANGKSVPYLRVREFVVESIKEELAKKLQDAEIGCSDKPQKVLPKGGGAPLGKKKRTAAYA